MNEKKDMSAPRPDWGVRFYCRCEEVYSQTYLEGFKLNQVMRGESVEGGERKREKDQERS